MNDRSQQVAVALSISAVERDTGLSKDTLRVWERRYGFPSPDRDQFGERVYPLAQVEKLRLLRRLMDVGHRPGKIIGLSVEALHALAARTIVSPSSVADNVEAHDDLQQYLDLVKLHAIENLRRALSQALLRMGLERFVVGVVAPLNRSVGEAWSRGYFEVFEEHLYTESMQVILRNAISTIPAGSGPSVLLTTFPQESHGLGLLMAEAIMALEGCRCISLGVQTPICDITRAARSRHTDIVALSFSSCVNPNQIVEGLNELRANLDPAMEIWTGGSCPVLQRKPPRGIHVLHELNEIRPEIARWRKDSAQVA